MWPALEKVENLNALTISAYRGNLRQVGPGCTKRSVPVYRGASIWHEGYKCEEEGIKKEEGTGESDEAEFVTCHGVSDGVPKYTNDDYNMSDAPEFYNEMKTAKYWKELNFVACHGGFIRNLVAYVMSLEPKTASENVTGLAGLLITEAGMARADALASSTVAVGDKDFYVYKQISKKADTYLVARHVRQPPGGGAPPSSPSSPPSRIPFALARTSLSKVVSLFKPNPYKLEEKEIKGEIKGEITTPKVWWRARDLTDYEMIMLRLEEIEKNNLFIIHIPMSSLDKKEIRNFYMIRHCRRQYQGTFSLGLRSTPRNWNERTEPDPQCVRVKDDQICNEEEFKGRIDTIMKEHPPEKTVGVFSSCMRRATETARVILEQVKKTAERSERAVPEQVMVVPYCREQTNILGIGGLDRLNTCSDDTMKRLREKCLQGVKAPTRYSFFGRPT